MKFLLKILIIISFFWGNYLFYHNHHFSEFLYKSSLHMENIREYTNHIILQNRNINNITKDSQVEGNADEYILTIFNEHSLNNETKNFFDSSDFSILNLKNNNVLTEENFQIYLKNLNVLNNKNFLITNNQDSINDNLYFHMINKNLYRFFNYNNFSIAYLKPKVLNYEDLLQLYKYLNILENTSYLPIILIDKTDLNEKLLKHISNKKAIFIILDDNFSISCSKNTPIIHLDSREDSQFIFQFNVFLLSSNFKKLRFKIFPLDKNIPSQEYFQKFLYNLNNTHKVNTYFDENKNVECIYFDSHFN